MRDSWQKMMLKWPAEFLCSSALCTVVDVDSSALATTGTGTGGMTLEYSSCSARARGYAVRFSGIVSEKTRAVRA